MAAVISDSCDVFQSTPSARRATQMSRVPLPSRSYFNPRPPRGERPDDVGGAKVVVEFQSTPSARRATGLRDLVFPVHRISIHALREESDLPNTSMSGTAA